MRSRRPDSQAIESVNRTHPASQSDVGASARQEPVQVGIADMIRACGSADSTGAGHRISQLPVHAQFLLAALLTHRLRNPTAAPTLGQLHTAYASMCREMRLPGVSATEFGDLYALHLADIVSASGRGSSASERRQCQLSLMMPEAEIRQALLDAPLVGAALARAERAHAAQALAADACA